MDKQPTLVRALGLTDATMLVIGCIVGVGIFRTASSIAGHLQSPSLILMLWLFGGLLSLCGALCYAELAAMYPATGGDYVYIREIYGRFWAFLFGWTKLFIERTGTIAILGFVFAEYVRRIIPYSNVTLRLVAASAILLLTLVNITGIRLGTYVQNLFTVLKIVALGALIFAGISLWTAHRTIAPDWTIPPLHLSTIEAMGVALVFVLWTYGGWTEAAYVAEEVRDATRNVPKAIIGGVLLITTLYVLVNWSYLLVIPITQMPSTPLVASRVMQSSLGGAGALFMSWMIACSAFGALNGYILTGGRILYAIGKDHALFAALGTVHPRLQTPALALGTNALVAIGLVYFKTFDQIAIYSTTVIEVFFALSVFGVLILRRRDPARARPYRTWGYPLTPIIFCLTIAGLTLDLCLKTPAESAFGFALLALGVPLYWWSCALKGRSVAKVQCATP